MKSPDFTPLEEPLAPMSDLAFPAGPGLSSPIARAREKLRDNLGRRLGGALGALAIEALLLLALLSLGAVKPLQKMVPVALSSFDVREDTQKPAQPDKVPKQKAAERTAAHAPQAATQPSAQPNPVAQPPQPATVLPLNPQVQSFDLSKIAKAPAAPSRSAPLIGPVDTPRFGDSERVGTAPNGQPMYAAAWYPHEPTHEQMAGYLSTAEPGWALVTCKTVPDYRVEDCVGLDEYPDNSHLIQAVLAAAWQFRIRPPRVNGVTQVGDWVRIRVTYEEVPAGNPYGDPSKR